MKRKWKYANFNQLLAVSYWLMAIGSVILITSCKGKHETVQSSNIVKTNLDGLVQPVNKTVFSNVKTTSPTEQTITPVIKSVGIISYDPRLVNNISARYGGRIDKLYIRFNFQNVRKGERIMDIYSPEILTEQQNLIYLVSSTSPNQSIIASSEQKLKLFGLTDEQLKQIETKKKAITPLPVYSPYTGHIHDIGISSGSNSMAPSSMNNNMSSPIQKDASPAQSPMQIENLPSSQTSALSMKEGMYVQSGQAVFAVYNTSQVWAVLDVYPKDAELLKIGNNVVIIPETNSEDSIHATINYIEPISGQNASTIKTRVYLQNMDTLHLKIGTLLVAKIFPAPVKGLWIPRSAVVDLGNKKVVFVQDKDHFIAKSIQAGITTDSFIQILGGLSNKDKIAVNAQYLVDSESFIKTDNGE